MKTTLEPEQAKTDFHYFCSLIYHDIGDRMANDATNEKCFELANKLRETIASAQEFYGHDAPVDELVLMNEINTFERPIPLIRVKIPQVFIDILRQALTRGSLTVLFLLATISGFGQNDAMGYVAKVAPISGDATELKVLAQLSEPTSEGLILLKPGDTIRVGLRLSCKEPQYIWIGYRVRVKLSASAYGHKYLGPDKKPLPKGCRILEIIWPMKKGTEDITPE